MTFSGLVEPDGATLIDPYVFAFGFFLMAAGLVMSQRHGDQRILLPCRSGLPFNLLQKTSGAETLAGAVLGFWIVGAWWSLWLPVLKLLSGFPVSMLGNARHRLPITWSLWRWPAFGALGSRADPHPHGHFCPTLRISSASS
jgi:hypothetical protein